MEIEFITIISTIGMFLISKSYKKIKYLKEKKKLKNKLIKAIQENNKKNIKKYIIKFKDFDKKYNKRKLLKCLEYCCRIINDLDEPNIFSLMNNFDLLNIIYKNEKEDDDINIHENLNQKLKILEKKRKEILIRSNHIQAHQIIKSNKINKNIKKKKGGKLG